MQNTLDWFKATTIPQKGCFELLDWEMLVTGVTLG